MDFAIRFSQKKTWFEGIVIMSIRGWMVMALLIFIDGVWKREMGYKKVKMVKVRISLCFIEGLQYITNYNYVSLYYTVL